MKKYIIFLFSLMCFCFSGCSIDYDSYYEKYGDVSNKSERPNSYYISDEVLSYPMDNSEKISKYGEVYKDVNDEYQVYASYYSSKYDTIYISYDKIDNPTQTINSKQLAMIEEHLLYYFVSDIQQSDYKDYLKAVRIYPDYRSSSCREINASEEEYSSIEGCANYNSLEATISLNGLTTIDRFFNSHTYNEGNLVYYKEPKRDTFAHEFGHVSTYYYLILKGDDSYTDYLKLRLGDAFDTIYESGLPDYYDSDFSYYIQPVEILADDYVELFYDLSAKNEHDTYDYELEYNDLRNSLSNVTGVVKKLKDDEELYNSVKSYYNVLINNGYVKYDDPFVVSATGTSYNTMHDIINNREYVNLEDDLIVVLGEITIDNKIYYRVVLSNVINTINSREEYSYNIGYILKDSCINREFDVILFTKHNGETLTPLQGLGISLESKIFPYYDFSYFIIDNNKVKIYNHLDDDFVIIERNLENFL